jgi:hypothetical protein
MAIYFPVGKQGSMRRVADIKHIAKEITLNADINLKQMQAKTKHCAQISPLFFVSFSSPSSDVCRPHGIFSFCRVHPFSVKYYA